MDTIHILIHFELVDLCSLFIVIDSIQQQQQIWNTQFGKVKSMRIDNW